MNKIIVPSMLLMVVVSVVLVAGCESGVDRSVVMDSHQGENIAAVAADASGVSIKTPYGYTISRETTYFTGPVGPDGGLDIVAALNNWASDGVTADNNLAKDMCEILGADVFLDESIRDEVVKFLGAKKLPASQRFKSYEQYYQANRKSIVSKYGSAAELEDLPDDIYDKPWSAEKYPAVAAWLEVNKVPLDKLVSVTLPQQAGGKAPQIKDRFYVPCICPEPERAIIASLMPNWSSVRNLARTLSIRGRLRMSEGKYDLAQRDFLAVLAMARSFSGSGMLITELISYSIGNLAHGDLMGLVDSGKLTSGQLLQLQRSLQLMRKPVPLVDVLSNGERAYNIGCVLDFARLGTKVFADAGLFYIGSDDADAVFDFPPSKIDWDIALRQMTYLHDKCYRAVAADTEVQAEALAQEFQQEREALGDSFQVFLEMDDGTLARLRAKAAKSSDPDQRMVELSEKYLIKKWRDMLESDDPAVRASRSKLAGDYIINMMFPDLQRSGTLERKMNTLSQLTDICIALELYKADGGAYPASLQNLADKGLYDGGARDKFGYDLVYKPAGNFKSFKLYSVGANDKDEGGSDEGDADDVAPHRFGDE